MGKTIQAIALLLTQRRKPNLVAAPTVSCYRLVFCSHAYIVDDQVALMQWKNEIETHTNKALSVYIYHGMGIIIHNISRLFNVHLATL